jgi:hypothetical protein
MPEIASVTRELNSRQAVQNVKNLTCEVQLLRIPVLKRRFTRRGDCLGEHKCHPSKIPHASLKVLCKYILTDLAHLSAGSDAFSPELTNKFSNMFAKWIIGHELY